MRTILLLLPVLPALLGGARAEEPSASSPLRAQVEAYLQQPDCPWNAFEVEGLAIEAPRNAEALFQSEPPLLETRGATARSLLLYAQARDEAGATHGAWIRVRGTL